MRRVPSVLECVVNVSEGRDADLIGALADVTGPCLLDVHRDADHHRAVFTVAGAAGTVEAAVRRLAIEAVGRIDLRSHHGAHPRIGSLDVVPWIHLVAGGQGRLADGDLAVAVAARDRFARWAGDRLGLPCFEYGPDPLATRGAAPTLPDLRRGAWRTMLPDTGPPRPHPSAGAACVGARRSLVAYNLWLADADLATARRIAAALRGPQLRALGLRVGDRVQVSCNLIHPWSVGPGAAYDAVAGTAEVAEAELVGLLPRAVLDAIPSARWTLLGLDATRTIEARLWEAGLDGGRTG